MTTERILKMSFVCLECGTKYSTARSAERAVEKGCRGCVGSDIDLDVAEEIFPADSEENYGGAFDGFSVISDADPIF